ncbi:MAG: nuclear transport factor 2 family protein [Acidobacteria bacterium]|nr:nuclear transport factor 2 family protein [Acidobacteriota bacterium]MBI3425334.1 nuclear transport factor 2 family protein [Acidobacteriota bacterium]
MKTYSLILVLVLVAGCALVKSYAVLARQPAANETVVRKFEAAFNKHDVVALAALVTDDAQWLSIDGDKLSVETGGKAALETWLTGYFKSCPSCHSEFEAVMAADRFVTVHERAMWESKSGPKAQRRLSVYELRDGLIRRVWYYPAEK